MSKFHLPIKTIIRAKPSEQRRKLTYSSNPKCRVILLFLAVGKLLKKKKKPPEGDNLEFGIACIDIEAVKRDDN